MMNSRVNIFVTGLTSSAPGGMEYHNLGNFVIAEPLFRLLRKTFPGAHIATSIQMSSEFYQRFEVRGVHERRFWTYGWKTALSTAIDVVRVLLWKLTRLRLLLSSPLLSELEQADLVIDFSGDVYGDNASWNQFVETNARLALALALGKKTGMIVGSPGPFGSLWRLLIAKLMLDRLDLVTNREPLSTAMLEYVGIGGRSFHTTACPSVFFEAADIESLKGAPDYPVLFEEERNRPIWGIILSGWNMPVGPYNRWPRDDWEFESFVQLIQFLREQTPHRVCLMSHQNATTDGGMLCEGNDHRIIDRLLELIPSEKDDRGLFRLSGLYDAAESKAIIGRFDVLMSGRIHGAVQGLSQGIPTGIIDYGHAPKAHKLRGFARLYDVDELVCDPSQSSDMQAVARKLLEDRETWRHHLQSRVEEVRQSATRSFALLRELLCDS